MATYFISNTAVITTLDGAINDTVTTLNVDSATGYPSTPFKILINDEVIEVGAKSGVTFSSLTRGHDGTSAASHSDSDTVQHVISAEDYFSTRDDTSGDHVALYDLDMNGKILLGPLDPAAGTHVGDRDYNDARYLELSGGIVTGEVTLDGADLAFDNADGQPSGWIEAFPGATREVLRLGAGTDSGETDQTFIQIIGVNDTSAAEINARFGAASNLRIISGQVLLPDGSEAAPGAAFINETDSGFWSSGIDEVSLGLGGTKRYQFETNALHIGPDNGNTNTSIELGPKDGTAGTPVAFIDFNTGGASDFDARIRADGGHASTTRQATLRFETIGLQVNDGNTGNVEIFPYGSLLMTSYDTSTTTPGASSTDLVSKTVTLDYSGQPVRIFAWGSTRCTGVDENEYIQSWIEISGNDGLGMRSGAGNVTGAGHSNHTFGDSTISASVSVSDTGHSSAPHHHRVFTPGAGTFTVKLQGLRSGSPSGFDNRLTVLCFRG